MLAPPTPLPPEKEPAAEAVKVGGESHGSLKVMEPVSECCAAVEYVALGQLASSAVTP